MKFHILLIIGAFYLVSSCGTELMQGDETIPPKNLDNVKPSEIRNQPTAQTEKEERELAPTTTLVALKFDKLKNKSGQVCYSIFEGSNGYPSESAAIFAECMKANASSGPVVELKKDTSYGIAAFHDENSNGKLDTRSLGPVKAPKEGYGFSSNPGFKPGQPSYSEISFTTSGDKQTESIEFIYLF